MKMLMRLMGAVLILPLFVGCGGGDDGNEEAAENEPDAPGIIEQAVSAPVEYLGAVNQANKYSRNQVAEANVKHAVKTFRAMEGRWPNQLKELVDNGYLPKAPELPRGFRWHYDPRTGTVSTVAQ